jgi:hypothetical protein
MTDLITDIKDERVYIFPCTSLCEQRQGLMIASLRAVLKERDGLEKVVSAAGAHEACCAGIGGMYVGKTLHDLRAALAALKEG